jgi:hypothetical protein
MTTIDRMQTAVALHVTHHHRFSFSYYTARHVGTLEAANNKLNSVAQLSYIHIL